ncbi:MAG: hypothetical protein GY906_02405 [bacterium]|nr:hypothetical protein [bacterium]
MTINQQSVRVVDYLWKIPLCGAIYFMAGHISGFIVSVAGLEFPEWPGPEQGPPQLLTLLAALLLATFIALLARGIGGALPTRALKLAVFTYVCFGFNNHLEALIFTTMGGFKTMTLYAIIPCLAIGTAAAHLFRPSPAETTTQLVVAALRSWWWRIPLVIVLWPVIYYFFGMLASPFVIEAYQTSQAGLILPSQAIILSTQLLRSTLYLVVILPIVFAWTLSRRNLILSLGLAVFATMGLVGLVETTFFPPLLRIVHSIEILGDAMVYGWVIVALFAPKNAQLQRDLSVPEHEPTTSEENPSLA